ncbi:unnamed protein product [Cochlearia groenlandica]
MQRQRHNRSKSWNIPEKKKLEEEEEEEDDKKIIDCSLNASQRFKLDLPRFLEKSNHTNKNQPPNVKVHSFLKQEIQELEKRLQNQFDVRGTLEKALGYKTPSRDINTKAEPTQKLPTELIKEIAVLESEVSHLEQYLLSLYRKAFDQQTASPASEQRRLGSPKSTLKGKRLDFSRELESRCFSFDNRLKSPCFVENETVSPSLRFIQEGTATEHRCLSFDKALKSPCLVGRELDSTSLRFRQEDTYIQNGPSLAEHMGTRISDHVFMIPNKLSEEMIKCVSSIYTKLADPPSINNGFSSPSSSPSSTSEFSPTEQYDMWSPSFRKNPSFDDKFEFSGPYSSMIEVSYIHRNHRKGRDLDLMNRNLSLLIKKLESVDPRKLSHHEKLAFWINVHNTLVMHTFLVNGIPQNNGKRFLLLSKLTYNIGGRVVSIEAIQSYILRIKMPRPGQWLKLLLIPRKFRTGDEHQEYSLDHTEPLLYFALCSGNHSDPAIRIYTPKGIYQELETAKEEYIRATFGVKKDQKLVLPKIIESFSKDSGLSQAALMDMVQECVPETMKKTVKKLISSVRSRKKSIVEWAPHSFVFRYLIGRELVR